MLIANKNSTKTLQNLVISTSSAESIGTYSLKTGFYGLTDMPAEFQKALDYTLVVLQNNYCFLDDIIIIRTGSES